MVSLLFALIWALFNLKAAGDYNHILVIPLIIYRSVREPSRVPRRLRFAYNCCIPPRKTLHSKLYTLCNFNQIPRNFTAKLGDRLAKCEMLRVVFRFLHFLGCISGRDTAGSINTAALTTTPTLKNT